ncbi:hypothetical protein LCGC14_0525980 [marine sediment metagenome]|uniref:Phospho-N-acetylmuramoyl-pentapeptide-transferase n=1 Tax=marine sediment metagenome TaxID=412755 RepID=A0A0F9S1R4_9ZZZZ|nr:phospho-N-acetylmuramoyl-pentapeptide-transferase [Actinomycetota bacterium]
MLFSLYPTYQVFITALFALVLTAVLTPIWVSFQRSKNVGQVVRTDGPSEHLQKEGTPTMGGLLIILSVIVLYFLMVGSQNFTSRGALALGIILATGVIGFIDDISKVRNARSLGLKARYKLVWLLVVSLFIGYFLINNVSLATTIAIPLTKVSIDLGWLYLPFLFLVIAGTTNAVNLTDGLDGLAAGTATIVLMAFAAIAFKQGHLDLAILAGALAGSCVGFLWFNSHPANIFMGDTGSFALGGAIAAMAILTKTELFLVVIGGIYVVESVSVILQVVSFKYFNKRIFKMAPIHHHFEMLGWSETTIMVRFWIISGIFAGAGFALYFTSGARGGL